MEAFLKSVERPAYRMALIACRNRDDALDLVQDAMCTFVAKYAAKPREAWKPLLYKMVQNGIRDHARRRAVRSCVRDWFGLGGGEDEERGVEQCADMHGPSPEHATTVSHAFDALQRALADLPRRQQQAFLLRGWEELSVTDTAKAMGCTEGSVKTHYSRAVHTLRAKLGEHWP